MVNCIHESSGGGGHGMRNVGGRKVWAGIQVAAWACAYKPLSVGLNDWAGNEE